MKKYKTLETWIREALSDQDKDAQCTSFAAVYLKPGGGTKEIHSLRLAGKTWDPSQLAALFQGKCESFAQDLGGMQQFELLAFYGEAKEPQATHPFRIVDGELLSGGSARIVKETADAPGLTAQLMRHLERTNDILSGIVQTMAKNSIDRESRLYDHQEKLQSEINESYVIVREMMFDKLKIDHESRMKELEYTRQTEERKNMMRLLPALTNTVAGREVFPQSAADSALLDNLAEKVNPDDIQKLVQLGVISQEVAGPLMVRLSQTLEQKKKEAEATKMVPEAKNVSNGGLS